MKVYNLQLLYFVLLAQFTSIESSSIQNFHNNNNKNNDNKNKMEQLGLSTLAGASAQTAATPVPIRHRNLASSDYAVYQGKFPLTAEFRAGPRGFKKSYADWVEKQMMPYGHAVDLQTNVLRFEPSNWKYANRFAEEHPETMMLSTWRAASGLPKGHTDDGDPLAFTNIEFPGHWVLSPGTTLSSSIGPNSETIRVASTANMRKGPALLVETTGSGDKRWDRYEYVLIKSVSSNSVSVRREFNGSPDARSFPAKNTEILPMPWDNRNRVPYVDWFFNYSRHCPKDENGKTAMDIILRDMVYPLKKGGPLDKIAGIDLGSGPLVVDPKNADYDLDGKVDDKSVYFDGVETFYKKIRNVIGDDGVLTTSLDWEFGEYINGANQEGLAHPNDPWEHVSRTVNQILSWEKFAELPTVGLAFLQYMNREETLMRVQLTRLLTGYSVCLGMAADVETGSGSEALDEIKRIELYKGDEEEPHWLGKAKGVSRPAYLTKNLLNGSNGSRKDRDWKSMMPNLEPLRGTTSIENGDLVLTPNKGNWPGYLTLDLEFTLDEKSDFVVYMEAMSDKNDGDTTQREILKPTISGIKVETDAPRGDISDKDYVPLSFYFRGGTKGKAKIGFRFDKGGAVRFRSISVHKAADTLACEFENGVVLVNPSLDDVSFDLDELFPDRRGFKRLSASPPKNSKNIPDKYKPQLKQAMELNNGKPVTNTDNLKVPQRNALFLIADKRNKKFASPVLPELASRKRDPGSGRALKSSSDSTKTSTAGMPFFGFGVAAIAAFSVGLALILQYTKKARPDTATCSTNSGEQDDGEHHTMVIV